MRKQYRDWIASKSCINMIENRLLISLKVGDFVWIWVGFGFYELVSVTSTTAVGILSPVFPGQSERKIWAPVFSPQRTARFENRARPQIAAGRQGPTAASAIIL